jgi:fumarate reductase subunit D
MSALQGIFELTLFAGPVMVAIFCFGRCVMCLCLPLVFVVVTSLLPLPLVDDQLTD